MTRDDLFDLQDKRVLITGGSQGIGRAIAEAFGRRGADVAVHYRSSRDAAAEVVRTIESAGGKAFMVKADLSKPGAITALTASICEHWDALDILINNAGDMIDRSELEAASDDLIHQVLQLNLTSTIDLTRQLIPALKNGKSPAIINLTSISAYNGGQGGVSLYSAAKGGILGLTRALARELAPDIRVNGIAPGVIITDMHRRMSKPERLAEIARNTPLARNGEAEDCVGAALLLASPAGAFITGEIIHVNGGLWMA